jgi:predicted porin
MNTRTLSFLSLLSICSAPALAQSTVTLYGTLDQYVNHMRSSSGASVTALEDGAVTRSRFGFRGTEDLGGGLYAKFQLEAGFNTDDSTMADATRSFDRQSWVAIGDRWGEVRVGRQNTAIFGRGDYIDFTSRTLGSLINSFGAPARYDNDISYVSPRVYGFLFEAHYALAETLNSAGRQAVYQLALDYLHGPYRAGYAGLRGRAPETGRYRDDVKYDNLYANYDHGNGKVYLVYVRSNNSTSTAAGNNAGSILGNVGGVVAGRNADVNRYYRIWQLSADYRLTPLLRVGALYGKISDEANTGHDASGGSVAAYYDLSKRTMVYGVAERLKNGPNAGFRVAGSAGLKSNFAAANDVNGRTISGIQAGILHRF